MVALKSSRRWKKSGYIAIKHCDLLYLPHGSKGEPITQQPEPALQPEQSRKKHNSSSFTHSTTKAQGLTVSLHTVARTKHFKVERFEKDTVLVERPFQQNLQNAAVIIKE